MDTVALSSYIVAITCKLTVHILVNLTFCQKSSVRNSLRLTLLIIQVFGVSETICPEVFLSGNRLEIAVRRRL